MLKSFFGIFKERVTDKRQPLFKDGLLEVATIFLRVGKLDNQLDSTERKMIQHLLLKRFKIKKDQLETVLNEAERLETEINDNIQLTKKIKCFVEYDERFDLLKDIWKIILADNIKSYEEVSFMRLLSNLIGLSDKDNALARKEASKDNEG